MSSTNSPKGTDYLYQGQMELRGVHDGDTLKLTDHERDELKVLSPEDVFPEYFVIRVNQFDKPVIDNYLEEWMDYLKYVCLGGNQAWDWGDLDSPFRFARLLIKNSAMTDGEVKAQMLADFPGYEAYHAAQPEPEPEPDGIVAIERTTKSATDVYTLSGQKANAAYKGLVIKNGVKALQK